MRAETSRRKCVHATLVRASNECHLTGVNIEQIRSANQFECVHDIACTEHCNSIARTHSLYRRHRICYMSTKRHGVVARPMAALSARASTALCAPSNNV